MLGHELRNPLSALRGATDLLWLKQSATDGGVAPETLVLDRQLTQLTRIVDDLLDVARLTRGKVQLFRSHVQLDHVVQLATESVAESISKRSQSLDVTLPEAPVELYVDPARIAQVIANLVLNASKYSPDATTIRLVAEVSRGLELTVLDEGIGIPEDMLDTVFEPFVQATHDFHRLGDGLGLGLTLVRSLVELHGGTVQARSAGSARGSQFVVRLPISGAAPPDVATPDLAAAPEPRSCSMLVVDDNVDSADLLAELLRAEGNSVEVAHDGSAALRCAEQCTPDMAFVDLALPDLDGFAVARLLRARFGEAVRLVAITGYGRDQDRRAAREAGFAGYLVKPVTREQVSAAVAALEPRRSD
jgi:CheY-like chemotaxis protein/two-component sensor histidine kinase